MFRKYDLGIHVNEGVSFHDDALFKIFGCSISEPSNWFSYGFTKERGLTFLDNKGKELESDIFAHQPVFSSVHDKNISEKNEIKDLIYQALLKNYDIHPSDVTIEVTEADIY
jgi:hypothetical protein